MKRFPLAFTFGAIWLIGGCGARTSDDDLLGPYTPSASVGGSDGDGDIGDGDGDGDIGDGDSDVGGGTGNGGSGGFGGNCCVATEDPGCGNPTIEECVCAFDAFCCSQTWDQACVDEAENFCDAGCTTPTGGTGGALPTGGTGGVLITGGTGGSGGVLITGGTGGQSSGNCCDNHGGVGCENRAIEQCVCGIDPFCCDTRWDQICIDEARRDCGASCIDPGTGGTSSGGAPPTGGTTGTGGLINQCEILFDDECGVCTCNNCINELSTCLGDIGCLLIFECIERTGCSGFDCYQPGTCQSEIDLTGGLTGSSAQSAFALGLCVGLAGCPCN